MFVIFYNKLTKSIVSFRHDTSMPQTVLPEQHFHIYCKNHNFDLNEYDFFELAWDENLTIVEGSHLFNTETKQIESDPTYVPPSPSEQSQLNAT